MNRVRTALWLSLFLIAISLLVGCMANNDGPDPKLEDKLVDRIVFFSDSGNGSQIYMISPEGKDLATIQFNLPSGVKISGLQWSKAAQRWAFSGVTSSSADIYIASLDGKTVQNITDSAGYFTDGPAFSPDGKRIAYIVSEGGQNTAVATSLIDGSSVNRVSKMPTMETSPVWLPDNNHLLIFSSKEGSPNIFKASIDGSLLVNLSKGPGLDNDLSVADNGLIFVFISDRAHGKNLFAYDLKTDQISQLTTDIGNIYSPKISPDGTKVVFRAEKDGSDLFVLDLANKSTTQLTHTPKIVQQDISWSPDSQNILYSADNQGQKDVFLIDLTGKITNLTNRPSNDYGATWIRVLP